MASYWRREWDSNLRYGRQDFGPSSDYLRRNDWLSSLIGALLCRLGRGRGACACRNSNSHVQMMKSAEKWRRQNATNGMYCSRRRRVLVDRKVRASLVIVGRVRSQQMAEMPLAEHDNVVKTFPPDRTDRPFTISVLPRRSRRGWPIPNAHRPKAADEDVTVDGVAVTNDVSRRYFPTIGLGELVRNPFGRWVRGHSQPQDLAAIVMQYQQPVEQSE